jgi:hypothetical protein
MSSQELFVRACKVLPSPICPFCSLDAWHPTLRTIGVSLEFNDRVALEGV